MDTTPEYIKMCEKAIPDVLEYFNANITRLRPMFIYDMATERVSVLSWAPKSLRQKLDIKNDEIILSIEYENDRGLWISEGTEAPIVPLWRQDQLQEIYVEWAGLKEASNWTHSIWTHSILDAFQFFALDDPPNVDLTYKLRSLEQLWLAFVMEEKYGKVWNGDEWVGGD